jgi:hypothetical protein
MIYFILIFFIITMDYKRNKKSDKNKATKELYGKFASRHVRIQTKKLEDLQKQKIKK